MGTKAWHHLKICNELHSKTFRVIVGIFHNKNKYYMQRKFVLQPHYFLISSPLQLPIHRTTLSVTTEILLYGSVMSILYRGWGWNMHVRPLMVFSQEHVYGQLIVLRFHWNGKLCLNCTPSGSRWKLTWEIFSYKIKFILWESTQ